MTPDQLELYINRLIRIDQIWRFYKTPEWLELRAEVLDEHNNECQECKKRGYHSRATIVHHEQWVRKHPRLALSKTYWYDEVEYKNLIPLCDACHNIKHPEKGYKRKKQGFTNVERW